MSRDGLFALTTPCLSINLSTSSAWHDTSLKPLRYNVLQYIDRSTYTTLMPSLCSAVHLPALNRPLNGQRYNQEIGLFLVTQVELWLPELSEPSTSPA